MSNAIDQMKLYIRARFPEVVRYPEHTNMAEEAFVAIALMYEVAFDAIDPLADECDEMLDMPSISHMPEAGVALHTLDKAQCDASVALELAAWALDRASADRALADAARALESACKASESIVGLISHN